MKHYNRVCFPKTVVIIILILCLTRILISNANALDYSTLDEKTRLDCLLCDPEVYEIFRFVEPRFHSGLKKKHELVCDAIKEGKWDRDKGHRYMYTYLFRLGACRGTSLNPDYREKLKEEDNVPDSVFIAYTRFCKETFDPAYAWRGEKLKLLSKKKEWLHKEVLCLMMHDYAYDNSIIGVLLEPDLPCVETLKKEVDRICGKLREKDGKFTIDDAIYEFQQADLEFQKQIIPQGIKKTKKELAEPFKKIIDFILRKEQ